LNTETQRHKGTKKAASNGSWSRPSLCLCVSVSLCLMPYGSCFATVYSREESADLPPILNKELGIHRLDGTRTRQVHGDDFRDPAGILGHHHDLIREKDRFVDAVGDEQGRFLVLLPYGEQ